MKKQTALFSAILSASLSAASQAAFDEGNAILVAYDTSDNDTFYLDTGLTAQALDLSQSINLTSAGLSAFIASNTNVRWGILGTINNTASVGGAPANGASFANRGVVATSLTEGNLNTPVYDTGGSVGGPPAVGDPPPDSTPTESSPTGVTDLNTGVDLERHMLALNARVASLQTAAAGAGSLSVNGSNSLAMNAVLIDVFFDGKLAPVDTWLYDLVFYTQFNPADGALINDDVVTSLSGPNTTFYRLGSDGTLTNECLSCDTTNSVQASTIPVPAAAWLFGSALLGLVLGKDNKKRIDN